MKNGWSALVMCLLAMAPWQPVAAAPAQPVGGKTTAASSGDAAWQRQIALEKKSGNPAMVAKSYFDSGARYSATGNLALAKSAYEQGLAYSAQHLPPNHPMTGLLWCQLSTIYMRTQDFSTALSLLGKSVGILDQWPQMAEVAFKLRGVRDMLASYNDGLQSMKLYDYTQAKSDFQAAVDVGQALQEPNIVSVSYSSMGWAQMMQEQYDDAETDIEKALSYAEMAHTVDAKLVALMAYGALKSREGDINAAKEYYQKALTGGSDADFQRVKISRNLFQQELDRLDMVQAELDKASASPQAADYYPDVMLTHKIFHWNNRQGVITIYLAPGNGVPGWKDAYAEEFKAACQRWQEVLGDQVRFEFTDDPLAKVDTRVTWNGGYDKKAGLTRYRYLSNKLVLADIDINLKNYDGQFYNPQMVYRLSLHEVGHLLGIAGHSKNPKDIMYPSLAMATDLSSRDIATMRKLYQQSPQISNPAGMTLAEYRDTEEYQKLKDTEAPDSHF